MPFPSASPQSGSPISVRLASRQNPRSRGSGAGRGSTGHPKCGRGARAAGRQAGGPADIWACGIVLFACLTGHLPYGPDWQHTQDAIWQSSRDSPIWIPISRTSGFRYQRGRQGVPPGSPCSGSQHQADGVGSLADRLAVTDPRPVGGRSGVPAVGVPARQCACQL